MPTNVRCDDDPRSSAEACSRARLGAPDARAPLAPANLNDGYTSEELAGHANEQLRSNSAANSNALLARVRQPRVPLRSNTSRVVIQRQVRGHGNVRPTEAPVASHSDPSDDEASSIDPAESSPT